MTNTENRLSFIDMKHGDKFNLQTAVEIYVRNMEEFAIDADENIIDVMARNPMLDYLASNEMIDMYIT